MYIRVFDHLPMQVLVALLVITCDDKMYQAGCLNELVDLSNSHVSYLRTLLAVGRILKVRICIVKMIQS